MQEYNLHSFSASHVYNTSTNGPHGGNKWNKQHKVVRKGSKKLQVLSPGSSFWLVFPPSNSWPNATFTVLFHPFPHLGSVIMLQPLHCLVYSLVSQRNIEPGETRERSTWWRLLWLLCSTWLCRKIWGGFFWRNLNTELNKMMQIARHLKNWDACTGSWV